MSRFTDRLWHRWLRRPYRLACPVDEGEGALVVLLHGLGRDAGIWQPLLALLRGRPFRVLAFDLLGFGASPKPDWPRYDVDDHARAVAASLRRRSRQLGGDKAILVGHSMGCLVAVRVARLHPELVRHLVLYEMPLYAGLPDKRRYRMRLDFYFRLYKRIIDYRPEFGDGAVPRGQRIAERIMGYKLSADTWQPFTRSLAHTIMEQQTARDLRRLDVPVDVIYGTQDRLVIRGETRLLFGEDASHITGHTIRERHRVTPKASQFLAARIEAAASGSTGQEIASGEPAAAGNMSKASLLAANPSAAKSAEQQAEPAGEQSRP